MINKLTKIQSELKAPKGQYNKFGKFKYRSAEDILEAVKPIISKYECSLTLSDNIIMVGDRIYVKATATLSDGSEKSIQTTAFAREEERKAGMDASQITGSASSYARKYALNGLFCIDDTKDADTMDNTNNDELSLAIDEVRRANSIEELKSIHSRWEAFKNNEKFLAELTTRKGQLK